MFCIVQAYIVESMQIRGYAEGRGSAVGQGTAQEGKIGFATGQHRGRSDALDAQIEELKKLLNDAAEELKNSPENRAQIGYTKTGANPGEMYPVSHRPSLAIALCFFLLFLVLYLYSSTPALYWISKALAK